MRRRALTKATKALSPYLLDNYPATAAYSLRQLKSDVVYVAECRRNDGTLRDFTAAEITDGTLETWASSTVVTIRTLYDQSGNSNDAIQTTVSQQNKIYSGSAFYLLGGKPAFLTTPHNGFLSITATDLEDMFFVGKVDTYKTVNYIAYGSNGGVFTAGTLGGYNGTGIVTNGTRDLNDETLNHSLHYFHWNGVDEYSFAKNDGVLTTAGIQTQLTGVNVVFGRNLNSNLNYNGKAQEMIFFGDEASNRENIRDEINEYYSIY